jgi:hypothetical protein
LADLLCPTGRDGGKKISSVFAQKLDSVADLNDKQKKIGYDSRIDPT